MSLAVALGQIGFALGAAVAGPVYTGLGYTSNTVAAAAAVLLMALLVWRFLPEPRQEMPAREEVSDEEFELILGESTGQPACVERAPVKAAGSSR